MTIKGREHLSMCFFAWRHALVVEREWGAVRRLGGTSRSPMAGGASPKILEGCPHVMSGCGWLEMFVTLVKLPHHVSDPCDASFKPLMMNQLEISGGEALEDLSHGSVTWQG
jgi:hypothetical protein